HCRSHGLGLVAVGGHHRPRRHGRELGAAHTAIAELLGNAARSARGAVLGVRAEQELRRSSHGCLAAQADTVRLALLDEGPHALVRLEAGEVQRQPVSRMTDGAGPGQILPEVGLLLGVAQALRELVDELGGELVHRVIQLLVRHHLVHQAPLQGRGGVHPLAQVEHLASAPLADDDRQPLRGPAAGNAANLRADLPDAHVIGGDGQVTSQVEFVASADDHAVQPRNRRLADIPQRVDTRLEPANPLPVVARAPGVLIGVLAHVAAGAEGVLAGAGEHYHRHAVVPRSVGERLGQLPGGDGATAVVDLGAIEGDARHPVLLLVQDLLELEVRRVLWLEMAHRTCSLLQMSRYRCSHTGRRFSRNALRPSWASGDGMISRSCISSSRSSAVRTGRSMDSVTARRARRRAAPLSWRKRFNTRSMAPSSSLAGTAWLARPSRWASTPDTDSPCRMSSSARCGPISLGSSTAAAGGSTPSEISGTPILASPAMITTSDATTSSQPPPNA